MTRIATAAMLLLIIPWLPAEGQTAGRVWRIGFFAATPRPAATMLQHPHNAFLNELRVLGYREGSDAVIEWRHTGGDDERRRQEATKLIEWKPDVVVTASGGDALALREVNTHVPIVVAAGGDLVGMGLAATLARSGTNVTGLQILSPELSLKRLQLLKELAPRLEQVALLHQAAGREEQARHYEALFAELHAAGRSLGLRVQRFTVASDSSFDASFAEMKRARVEAVMVAANPFMAAHRQRLGDVATRHRLPTMHEYAVYVESGGLISYGVNVPDLWRRAARYVDRILKGAQPADLPIEQPTTFQLVVNLKTAKALGLTIPASLQVRVDRVVE